MAVVAVLGICGSVRKASLNRALLAATGAALPEGTSFTIHDGLEHLPIFSSDLDDPPPVVDAQGRDRRGRRRGVRGARVQLLDPRRAQERARLGLAAAGVVAVARQAGRRSSARRAA